MKKSVCACAQFRSFKLQSNTVGNRGKRSEDVRSKPAVGKGDAQGTAARLQGWPSPCVGWKSRRLCQEAETNGQRSGGHVGKFGVKTRGLTAPFHGPELQKSEYAEG